MLTSNTVGRLASVAIICAICIGQASAKGEVGCFNEDGDPVDWYIGYKFPRIDRGGEFDTGHVYAYITSEDEEKANDDLQMRRKVEDSESITFLRQFKDLLYKFGGSFMRRTNNSNPHSRLTRSQVRLRVSNDKTHWVASHKLISDPESVIMRTLAPAYDKNLYDHISSVFYNDSPKSTDKPEELDDTEDSDATDESDEETSKTANRIKKSKKKPKSSRNAHAKGVLLMDEESNTGIWLTHSIPQFPNLRSSTLEFPSNAKPFGQTFMCVTFDLKKYGANLVDHLVNMRPYVYDRQWTDSIVKEIPNLENLDLYENSKFKRTPSPSRLAQTITTKDGKVLKLYSKAATFKHDLYGGWIDEDLGADLYVETWRRGAGGVLNSSCPSKEHHINNVKELKYEDKTWDYLSDHSKWAITDEQSVATICIADANRMQSQFKRGSGAVCMRCPSCWSKFSNTILDTEPCPIDSNKGSRRQMVVDKSLKTRIEEYLNATQQ